MGPLCGICTLSVSLESSPSSFCARWQRVDSVFMVLADRGSFYFTGDLRKNGASGPRTLKMSVNW